MIIIRLLCLGLFIIVAAKQLIQYKHYENGEKDLRLKLFGSTTAFVFITIAAIFLGMEHTDFAGYSHELFSWIVTISLLVGAVTWFYIYFIRK